VYHHRNLSFDDPEKWEKVYEEVDRDEFQNPLLVVQHLRMGTKSQIAIFGAGTGYFPVILAKIASEGRVYAVDSSKAICQFLKRRITKEKISNIEVIYAADENPNFPKELDAVLTVNTYQHFNDRIAYFENVRKFVKAEGRSVFIDWKKGKYPMGPTDDVKIAPEQIITEVSAAGWVFSNMDISTPYQYLLVFANK